MVVALIGDSTDISYPFSLKERAEAVSMLCIADAVILLDGDELEDAIRFLKPKVLVLGNEYKDNPIFNHLLPVYVPRVVLCSFMQVKCIMKLQIYSALLKLICGIDVAFYSERLVDDRK